MVEISVIIPIYNVERYLDQCLCSCLSQSFTDFEIVCVNDGSPDKSGEIVEKYTHLDTRVIYLQKENEGLLLARREGVSVAHGTYVLFLDADDYLPRNALELLYNRAKEFDADVVRGRGTHVTEDGDIISEFQYPPFNLISGSHFLNYMFEYGYHSVWGTLIKKTFFNSQIYYPVDVSIGEDLVYMVQISLLADKVTYIDKNVYYYVLHAGSMIHSSTLDNSNEKLLRGEKYFNLCKALDLICQTNKNRKNIVAVQLCVFDLIVCYLIDNKTFLLKNERRILSYWSRYFLFNFQIQRRVFKRSWKCYLSVLFDFFKLI